MKRPEQVLEVQEERKKARGEDEDYYSNIADTLILMGKKEQGLAVYDDAKQSYFKRAADRQELAELYMEWAGSLADVTAYEKAAKKISGSGDAIRGQPGKIQSGMACGEKLLYGRETRGSGALGEEGSETS